MIRSSTTLSLLKGAIGAALVVLCGLLIWGMPFGDSWLNASYDYSFRFGSRRVTNQVALILMDNEAYDYHHQTRGDPWDRALHARLLQRLAEDGSQLVVFDSLFRNHGDSAKDKALADAIAKNKQVLLMAEQSSITYPTFDGVRPILPIESFLTAANGNWGVGWLDPELDSVVRHHWPSPSPGPLQSLAWKAALLSGAKLDTIPQARWLRYYGPNGTWEAMSYQFALTQPSNYFRDKVIFIGNKPKTTVPDKEDDKFATPYTAQTGECVGGVEILLATYLNLVNAEWLLRPKPWIEVMLIVAVGGLLGGWVCQLRLALAFALIVVIGITIAASGIWLSFASNYWFPWLVIAGGQAPCALVWTLASPLLLHKRKTLSKTSRDKSQAGLSNLPETPDYELFDPPFGEGAYGKVWLARNAIGQWQALKAVYLSSFKQSTEPYEREFNGIKNYKPLSDKHPGLLRVEFVSRPQGAEYFYYVMELGDAVTPGWETYPKSYRPCDLASLRSTAPGRRLPVAECLRIGIVLSEALDFLHRNGLTHCDIKPQNIIFVNGQPKLADIGLVSSSGSSELKEFSIGTPGYMPPAPECSGTPQADIYSLGMVLYVIRTGFSPNHFPEVSSTLLDGSDQSDFAPLNEVIMKACHPDLLQRFTSAAELKQALELAQSQVGQK